MTPPGGWELILIVFVILLLFGGKKLPGLARSVGQSMTEFRKGTKLGADGDEDEDEDETEAADRTPRDRDRGRDQER
jgi:sec-independent protein translocase protein TatA